MIRNKLFAIVVFALSAGLYSCGCEDVNLGRLERSGELNTFLPFIKEKELVVRYENDQTTTAKANVGEYNTAITVPVKQTGKSRMQGKGAIYDCIEYYTTEEKRLNFYVNTNLIPLAFSVVLTKNIQPEGFTTFSDKAQVGDVMHFILGYHNRFPQTLKRGMASYDTYLVTRFFTLSKSPDQLINKKNTFIQEHLSRVTLNGVEHENVYHLYLPAPQFTPDEQYLNDHYALTYIKGIYVKEGIGLLQAYTSTGKKYNFSLE